MKNIQLTLFSILVIIFFSGCGPLTIVTTAFSVVTTAQEVEEEYEGDFGDYVDDKMETTYEYLEEKTSK
jgi:hypothetical protein